MKVRLTELQKQFLRLFPYQTVDGELIPLSGFRVDGFEYSTRQPKALIDKGLIRSIRKDVYSWSLTPDGEALLREIDPEWGKLRDDNNAASMSSRHSTLIGRH